MARRALPLKSWQNRVRATRILEREVEILTDALKQVDGYATMIAHTAGNEAEAKIAETLQGITDQALRRERD